MEEKKRLFKRLVQSDDDLAHAAECAEQILSRELHSATDRFDQRLLRCLNTALIVSYVRPFSGNRSSADVQKKLPREYLDVLSDEELLLHQQLIEARNRDQAHSDPRGRDVSVDVQSIGGEPFAFATSRDAFAPWERDRVERVAGLISKLREKLTREHLRLQAELGDAGSF